MKYRDVTDFAFQDLSFHEAIIAAAEHNRIMHLWTSIRQIVMTVMLITTEEIFSEGRTSSVRSSKHRTIVQGLESKDANKIQQVVQAYFADSRRTLHISLPQ